MEDSDVKYSSQSFKSVESRVLVASVIFALCVASFLFWQYSKPGDKSPQEERLPPQETLKKVDHAITSLPEEFPKDLPVYPVATVISSYNLTYEKTGLPKDGVVVFESAASVKEIYDYYKSRLLPPAYNLSKQPYPIESESFKILNFSTPSFMLIVRIERVGNKTQVQLINTNLDREVEMYKNS